MTTIKIDEIDPLAGELFILRAMAEINRLSPYSRRMKCTFTGMRMCVEVLDSDMNGVFSIYSETVYKGASDHMLARLIERAALRCDVPCVVDGEQVTDGMRKIKVTLGKM